MLANIAGVNPQKFMDTVTSGSIVIGIFFRLVPKIVEEAPVAISVCSSTVCLGASVVGRSRCVCQGIPFRL